MVRSITPQPDRPNTANIAPSDPDLLFIFFALLDRRVLLSFVAGDGAADHFLEFVFGVDCPSGSIVLVLVAFPDFLPFSDPSELLYDEIAST